MSFQVVTIDSVQTPVAARKLGLLGSRLLGGSIDSVLNSYVDACTPESNPHAEFTSNGACPNPNILM